MREDVPNAGEAYVVFGTTGRRPRFIDLKSSPASTIIIYGVDEGDTYGEELYGGDFNGDGIVDIAIGALSGDGPENLRQDGGELALILGPSSLSGRRIDLSSSPPGVTVFYGGSASETRAADFSIAGDTVRLIDINRDGKDDLIIASPQAASNGDRSPALSTLFLAPPRACPLALIWPDCQQASRLCR